MLNHYIESVNFLSVSGEDLLCVLMLIKKPMNNYYLHTNIP